MTINLDRSFGDYLEELRKFHLYFFELNIQEYIVEIYEKKGLSREKIFELPLKEVWPLIEKYEYRRKGEIWINTKTS